MLSTRLLQLAMSSALFVLAGASIRDALNDRRRPPLPEFDDVPEIRAHHERNQA